MEWNEIGALPCSIARSLAVVGDRWTLLILREAFNGVTRFDAFRERLGTSRNVLAGRLTRLTRDGVFEQRVYQEGPRRREYLLTEKGRELYPVLLSLMAWGDRWLAGRAGPPVRLIHDCGAQMRARSVCPDCGQELRAGEVRALAGPGLLTPGRPRQNPS